MNVEQTLRDVLSGWPLYHADDHLMVVESGRSTCIEYCGRSALRPFSASSQICANPPNLLSLNITPARILYLVFIQVEPQSRGKGHGAALYDCVVEFARRMGCVEVIQTPSGGYQNQTREEYLLKRGWKLAGIEVSKRIEA